MIIADKQRDFKYFSYFLHRFFHADGRRRTNTDSVSSRLFAEMQVPVHTKSGESAEDHGRPVAFQLTLRFSVLATRAESRFLLSAAEAARFRIL